MGSFQERGNRVYYQKLAEETSVFDTETGQGDPSTLDSLKKSAFEKARIILRVDPKNGPAKRVAKWVVRGDKELNTSALWSTFRTAGFETYRVIFNPNQL